MTINANVMVPGERYVFTLRARQDGQAADGFASTGAILVAGPPDPGTVVATPSEGTALDTMFTIATQGWGGGSLRYTLGYVLSDARGRDVDVPLLVESTLSQVSGLLPANVSSDHARIFAIARATDAHGASSRVEGTVRVLKTPRGDETKAAKRALETALRVGDPGMRAAAAVTAAAALNTPNTDRSSMPAADVKERREVRAGAMDAVSAAATRAIEDAVDGVEIDPGVLSTYVTSVAAVAAVPAELTKQTAELGLTTVTGLLRARSSMPAPIEVTSAAAAMVSGAVEVQLDSLVAKTPNATLNATTTTGGAVAVASTQLYGTRRRRLLRYRRLLQDDNSTNPVELIDRRAGHRPARGQGARRFRGCCVFGDSRAGAERNRRRALGAPRHHIREAVPRGRPRGRVPLPQGAARIRGEVLASEVRRRRIGRSDSRGCFFISVVRRGAAVGDADHDGCERDRRGVRRRFASIHRRR
jgi:hypothetical protein